MEEKSTVEEIRTRFDADVERFSNRDTGQTATVDAPLVLELLSQSAAVVTPHARHLLDVGCGAGNNALAILEQLPGLDVTLNDLSLPMLTRARERIGLVATGQVRAVQADIRTMSLEPDSLDIIVAAAVLHHLRTPGEWEQVLANFYAALRLGGSLWVSDLVTHSLPPVQSLMWDRYGAYLVGIGGDAYRDKVHAYIEKEDSPAPLLFQLEAARRAGFSQVDLLHKNSVFAAWGAVKT